MKSISSAGLEELMKDSTKMKLLSFFFGNPAGTFYEKEVSIGAKVSAGAANKGLHELASQGMLLLEKRGRMNFYRLNAENALVKQLKKTHSLSNGPMRKIAEMAERLGIEAWLYGSVARGEDTEASDIDILFIGSVGRERLAEEVRKIRESSKKNIKYMLLSSQEWTRLSKTDPAFYEMVSRDRIRLKW